MGVMTMPRQSYDDPVTFAVIGVDNLTLNR